MRLSLRTRLAALVGAGALGFVLIVIVGVLIDRRVQIELLNVQRRYVPKVELGPRLTTQFERVRRGFQDAVAAHDAETLATTRLAVDQLMALATADDTLSAADAETLRWALGQYQTLGMNVSERLMANETGEAMLRTMVELQESEKRVNELIERFTAVDRRLLDSTFATIVGAQVDAARVRLLVAIGFLFIVGLSSIIWARSLVTSLAALARGFERFGEGDLEHRIVVPDKDDVGEVARRANLMAERLHRLGEQHAQSEASLAVANKELEAFSYSVAHDLRAPLRGMNGFANLLLDGYADKLDDEGKDWLREILTNANKMGLLIDALLSLSRLTRAELKTEPVDLSALVRDVAADLAATNPARPVDVVVQSGVRAEIDPVLARAVFDNLLGNAWKFTSKSPSPRIEFGTTTAEGAQCFYVRDNGAGFDMAFAKKLFAPFQRLHTVAEFPGTGIGLATTQRIIHRHGGHIWAEGRVDHGATFFFTLADQHKKRTLP
jgi:signal transduction histidine kinase